ncbi:MAG: sigma-70 family RNA polymerase sigma factor [Planctomycetes bacterium]|nr:sigma-70 family RNA polymerase sigma factor [Planctomycetota bacterium]
MESTGSRPTGDVTILLARAREGDRQAFDSLMPLVYEELKRVAGRELCRERRSRTLDCTSLVHEAYLKLAGEDGVDWRGRAHFYCLAARAMRQILVDHARRRAAAKRGGGWDRVTLRGREAERRDADPEEMLALDDALARLGDLDARLREIVECKFFGGMTDAEIAAVLGVSTRTVERDWAKARAWLYREVYGDRDR